MSGKITNLEDLARIIKNRRIELTITQYTCANRAGIGAGTWRKIEQAAALPEEVTLKKILAVLNFPKEIEKEIKEFRNSEHAKKESLRINKIREAHSGYAAFREWKKNREQVFSN